jgi:hypothetical protein
MGRAPEGTGTRPRSTLCCDGEIRRAYSPMMPRSRCRLLEVGDVDERTIMSQPSEGLFWIGSKIEHCPRVGSQPLVERTPKRRNPAKNHAVKWTKRLASRRIPGATLMCVCRALAGTTQDHEGAVEHVAQGLAEVCLGDLPVERDQERGRQG